MRGIGSDIILGVSLSILIVKVFTQNIAQEFFNKLNAVLHEFCKQYQERK